MAFEYNYKWGHGESNKNNGLLSKNNVLIEIKLLKVLLVQVKQGADGFDVYNKM